MRIGVNKKIMLLMALTLLSLLTLFQMTSNTASANRRTVKHTYITRKARITRRNRKVYRIARRQLGKRYVWGAVGPHNFDCSGFVQYAYRRGANKRLARTAQMQYQTTKRIRAKHARRGDLVFFGTSRRNIFHVGLYLGKGKMIDAQNRGVIVERVHAPWWHVVAYSRV
jgi:cell wall-associated NlpC family hydrolase